LAARYPKHVHRVKRELKDGARYHWYYPRGGSKFFVSDEKHPTSAEFYAALAKATERPPPASYMVPKMVDDFLDSAEMPKGARTRADYRKWGLRFAEAFKDDPAKLFEEPASRREVNDWRDKWKHSPRQYDYAATAAARILNWAVDRGHIQMHHCHALSRVYEVDRAEIVWTAQQRAAVEAIAPEWIRRILTTACETGLRAGDLCTLSRAQIEDTPNGRRIRVRTAKRGRQAYIPVTPAMGAVIDATPGSRALLLVNASGNELTPHRISEGLRQWRDKAGLTSKELGYDLRLHDCRGTAATRLLDAGLSLKEIALHMGWKLRYAAAVIEKYAHVSPGESDAILKKLEEARKGSE